MTNTELDYGDDVPASEINSQDALARLAKLAEDQIAAQNEVNRIQLELSAANRRLLFIAETEIPALMDEVGIKEYKTTSGLSIKLNENMKARINKDAIEPYIWLEENGHADLIKRKITIEFSKQDEERARQIIDIAEQENLQALSEQSVHASTLAAFIKEQLFAGVNIPMDLFGVHWQRQAKVKSA